MNETRRLVTGTTGIGNGMTGQTSSAYGPRDVLPTINIEAKDISAHAEVSSFFPWIFTLTRGAAGRSVILAKMG